MSFKYAKFSSYFYSNRHKGKKFLSNPLKSTNQNIYFLCIEKLLWFVLDTAMVGFCLDSFIITCRGRTWHFQVTKCEYTSYCF